jgi:phage gp16-like protein
MTAPIRNARLAKVHIARKEMGLDEDAYRALVQRVTGRESASQCTDAQLAAVLVDMKRLGWKPAPPSTASQKSWVRKVWAIWASMAVLLDDPSRQALQTFVERQTKSARNPLGISDPDFLNVEDAKKVIHGLVGWRTRLLAGHAAAQGAADGAQ